MKLTTISKYVSYGNDTSNKILVTFCCCPEKGGIVQCEKVCEKCKNFRWYNIGSISCAYGNNRLTIAKHRPAQEEISIPKLPTR